jgi:uncharacterized protein YecE (DUF72 family)
MPRRAPAPADLHGDLFSDEPAPTPTATAESAAAENKPGRIGSAIPDPQSTALAAQLDAAFGGRLYLGTSSWNFSGWRGLVWDDEDYSETDLSRHGLAAYARHPLLRTVSLDRTFYRAIDAATFARLARPTPEHFRFVVKVPSEITDAVVRAPDNGAPLIDNPLFLDPQRALALAVQPAVEGLGPKLGVLVFQISPLPAAWLRNPGALHERLAALWRAVLPALPASALAALELRDARMLTPRLTAQLAAHGVSYCIGLHDRMPEAARQVPAARAAGRGDLICRWNLQQGLRYNQAKAQWAPFDKLHAPDPQTRAALAQAVVATLAEGYRAFVTINNKAEGSAPLSVVELAKAILREAGFKP